MAFCEHSGITWESEKYCEYKNCKIRDLFEHWHLNENTVTFREPEQVKNEQI